MQEDNLGRKLEAALARYAAVEPREGLEQRVLANLRAQQTKDGQRWESWQAWSAAGLAIAAMAVLLIWAAGAGFRRKAGIPKRQVEHEVSNTNSVNADLQAHNNLGSRAEAGKSTGHLAVAFGVRRPRTSGRIAAESGKRIPRLAQFPAPEPLSEQEKLLVRYVQDDPERAELIAEATALAERSSVANDAGRSSLFQSPEEAR